MNPSSRSRWRRVFVPTLGTILLLASASSPAAQESFSTREPVGRTSANRTFTPANQILTPAGVQVELPDMRPQALALSPDGRLLVTAGLTHDLVVLDPATGKILQRVPLPSDRIKEPAPDAISAHILEPDKKGQLSFTGLKFSPDGTRIFLSNVRGSIKVFGVEPGGNVSGLYSIPLPLSAEGGRKPEIPAGLAVSADGRKLYVALNLSNRLAELDASDGKVLRTWDVGMAPFEVVLAGNKAYVSNWGGRRPDADSLTGPVGQSARVRVDAVRHIANEGSVSVIELAETENANSSAPQKTEVLTGLHASALALSPSGRYVVVCNAGSDTLSVFDTRTDKIIETIWARQNPSDLLGAQPNALTFDPSGKKLFVCNGSQNAVAVFDFKPGSTVLRGLIPVGWFPGAVVFHPARTTQHATRDSLIVANIKALAIEKMDAKDGHGPGFNSHQYHGTLSLVPLPSTRELAAHTHVALANMRYPLLRQARLPARRGQPPRAVPERAGEPSLINHVIYIIKENRTYDQVLGDVHGGNGEPSLCVFGERITPNQHNLVREFVLLDNTYCSGILSADGHQWCDTGIATDYMERSFAGFPRSYPDGMGDDEVDALAYSPAGFIWDNALAHGKTLRDYGEFAVTEAHWRDKSTKGEPKFLDHYRDFMSQAGKIEISSRPAIESLRPHLCTNTVGWDMKIPDAFRAVQFIKELKAFEARSEFPNLTLICLPNDHTSGTKAGTPTPAAQVADNDLALGQIIEAVSRSQFWKDTCFLVIEDDPQAGWDHVCGYRTTCYVASPYAKRGAVVSTQYNNTSLLRTMELMLGLPPMNQLDATATPMTDCFIAPGEKPDLTPFTAVPNNVPFDEMNPDPKKISDARLRKNAQVSARLPLDAPDQCPEDTLNRILWAAMKGPDAPYPVWAVKLTKDADD